MDTEKKLRDYKYIIWRRIDFSGNWTPVGCDNWEGVLNRLGNSDYSVELAITKTVKLQEPEERPS